jgi:hypothetical protein
LRFLSTIGVVSLLAAHPGKARADGGEGIVQPKPSLWSSGPAGGAFGLFVEGGASAGCFCDFFGESFYSGSLGLGASLRWFEASFTGYYGSSFDAHYSGPAFLGRAALRVPVNHVAFSLGSELGYFTVPGHSIAGVMLEPVSAGVEIDPVCHLRIGLLGAFGFGYGYIFRGALTVGYVMGAPTVD